MNNTREYRERIYEHYASQKLGKAKEFDESAARRWARSFRRYVRGLLPAEKGTPIIDIGCGGGDFLYMLARMGYTNLHGVDISPEQVALARQVCGDVQRADATEYLEAHPNKFGAIFAFDVIEHFHKDEVLRFLDMCYAALVEGGRLVLSTVNAETPWGLAHRYHDFTHEVCFDPASLLHLLKLCGFERLEARERGPVPHGIKSVIRWLLWKILRLGLVAWNLIEMGSARSGVYTRVFIATGIKPEGEQCKEERR